MEITNINQLDPNGTFTYADYLLWKFKERVELVKGKILKMSPAPSRKHQGISWALSRQIDRVFQNKTCKMYAAPFDVRLKNFAESTADNEITTVVQPDLCVICDLEKLDDRGCIGSPDLIVEILSPGNSQKEMGIKFDLYEENGVREYWLVDIFEKTIWIYYLEKDKYIGLKPFIETEVVQSKIFPELSFPVKDIFQD